MRFVGAFVLAASCWILSGCNPVAEKAAAEAFATRVFAAREAGNADQLMALYGEPFFQTTSREKWSAMLAALESRLGRPQARELMGWKVFVGSQGGASGTFVSLSYAVRYEKAEGTEMLTLLRPSEASDFQIVGHQIHSPAFLPPELGGPPSDEGSQSL